MNENLKSFLDKWKSVSFCGEKRSYVTSNSPVAELEYAIELKIQYKIKIDNLLREVIETERIFTFNQSNLHEGVNPNGDLHRVEQLAEGLLLRFFEKMNTYQNEMIQELHPDGFFE